MILVLGGIPKLNNTLYITNRLKPNSRPCLLIPVKYIHLLFRALHYDNLITLNDIVDLESIIADIEDNKVSLELLEALSGRQSEVFLYLRGYFKEFDSEADENNDNIILPIIPGLANTSLLQVFTYQKENYVIDVRDFDVNIGFLKSIISSINGEVYVVSDRLILNTNEIIIGEKIDVNVIRNLTHEPYNFINKAVKLQHGRYHPYSDKIEFIDESNAEILYERAEPVDVIEKSFSDYANDIENLLYEIWSTGFVTEQNLLQNLMDIFSGRFEDQAQLDYASRVVIYLLIKNRLLEYINTPAGRQYYVTLKAIRNVLKRMKARMSE